MFALKDVEEVVGPTKIYKLEEGGICQFDEFCKEIRISGNLTIYLNAVFRILNDVSNNRKLPKEKYRPIKGHKNIFEVKKDILRIYLLRDDNGHIIVLGSKKGSQILDIDRVAGLQKRYLDSII